MNGVWHHKMATRAMSRPRQEMTMLRSVAATVGLFGAGLAVLTAVAAGPAAAQPPPPDKPCTQQNRGERVMGEGGTWVCLAPAQGTTDPYQWVWFPSAPEQ